MSAVQQKQKDPNWVCTFSLKKNSEKKEKKHPDLILVDSEKKSEKTGKPYRKNFTVNGVWMEASGYFQEDKSLKITIKKSSSSASTPPDEDNFADQF